MSDQTLRQNMETGIYRITQCAAIGRFPNAARGEMLQEAGFTHVLNVSGSESVIHTGEGGFQVVEWHRIPDLSPLQPSVIFPILDRLHQMLTTPDSQVYVHCMAGRFRCANLLWLYLVGCGIEESEAKSLILDRTLDASPGNPQLVYPDLIQKVKEYGKAQYLPLSRAEILEPA